LILCFATKPKTNELYSKCETCRPKHAKKRNAKRDAEVAEKKATIEARLESGELVRCQGCGPQPLESFATNPTTDKPLTRCKPCNEKKNAQNAEYQASELGKAAQKRYDESELGKERNKRYDESDKGKATEKRYDESELGKERNQRYDESDKGKATEKRYDESELGKERNQRYAESELGKASAKRYREGDAGQAAAKRFLDNRQERRRESTAMRMDVNIMSASNQLISGDRMTSPTFLKRTSFTSEVQYIDVLKAAFVPGMTLANHGPVWEVEHKIPREAYDFDDPEDVKRCWSVKNVHAMTVADNLEKSWKLLDEYITAAGVANFPKAWNGKHPDAAFKAIHNAKMVAQKAIDDEEAASEQPSGSNDVGPMDDFD